MKRIFLYAFFACCALLGNAQENAGVFRHLDLSVTAGSTGVGFDLSMPAGDYLRLRTGATFMPRFEYKTQFGVELLGDASSSVNREHFKRLQELLRGFTGNEVADHVDMMGTPSFNNFKFLVDVTPLRNKHWHATAGFYAGKKRIAKAHNTNESTVSLFTLNMYNDMYWRCENDEPIIDDFDFDPRIKGRFHTYGTMAMTVGYFKEDYYAPHDILWDHNVLMDDLDEDSPTYLERVLVHERGSVRYHEGELVYHAGEAYRMLPNDDNMVKVDAIVNKIRPYVGVGYSGALSKDGRTQIGIDAGVMMWGGRPQIVTHDGVDLMRDLTRINGRIQRYVDIASKLRAFPVLELRLSQRIF